MNLIEKLGGYESAKSIRDINVEEFDGDASGVTTRYMGNSFIQEDLELELLQYRRENNIFEVGDLVVILTMHLDNKFIHEVSKVLEDLVEVCGSYVYSSELRHTTPEEIKAGHRL